MSKHVCARTGEPIKECHYVSCAKGQCIERPGTVIKMFKRASKLEPSAPRKGKRK